MYRVFGHLIVHYVLHLHLLCSLAFRARYLQIKARCEYCMCLIKTRK